MRPRTSVESGQLDTLRTHPTVIVDGMVHDNPYYIEPDTFLGAMGSVHTGRCGRAWRFTDTRPRVPP